MGYFKVLYQGTSKSFGVDAAIRLTPAAHQRFLVSKLWRQGSVKLAPQNRKQMMMTTMVMMLMAMKKIMVRVVNSFPPRPAISGKQGKWQALKMRTARS